MSIKFYHQKRAFGWLSPFSAHKIVVDGTTWPTVEHYFQAMKFPDNCLFQEEIRASKSPWQAKKLAWSCRQVRDDWDAVKDSIMLNAQRAKFEQHNRLRRKLIDTGVEELIENSPKDLYWGVGKDGEGKNMLGKILMKVRREMPRNLQLFESGHDQ